GPCLVDEATEAIEVELVRFDPKEVARRLRYQPIAEHAPEAKNVVLERAERGRRRVVAPDTVDQALGRNDVIRLEQQKGGDGTAFRPADRQPEFAVENLGGAEDPELHSSTTILGSLPPRRPPRSLRRVRAV